MLASLALVCGLNSLSVSSKSVSVDSVNYDYRTTLLKGCNIYYEFSGGVMIRRTEKDRFAFRKKGHGNWRKCRISIYENEIKK